MSKVKGLFGEYELIGKEHHPKDANISDNLASFNDKGVQKIKEEKDYAKAIDYFDRAIKAYENDSNFDSNIEIVYNNRGIAKMDSGFLDILLSLGFDIRGRSTEDISKRFSKFNKFSELFKFFL